MHDFFIIFFFFFFVFDFLCLSLTYRLNLLSLLAFKYVMVCNSFGIKYLNCFFYKKFTNAKSLLALFIVGIIVLGGIGYFALVLQPSKAPPSTTSTSTSTHAFMTSFAVALTDPPSVPVGTSALILNYSSVELITNSSPYFANESGSVDLLSLVNISKIIATFSLPKYVNVNQIRLFVSAVTIEINGSKYSVFVPSSVLKIPVANVSLVNGTIGALVDLRPHIVTTYTGQSLCFILTPVAFAMPFSANELNVSQKFNVGQEFAIPKHISEELEIESANLTLEAVSLYSQGNKTVFYISLKNVGNEPVTIYAFSVQTLWNLTIKEHLDFFTNKSPNYLGMNLSIQKSIEVPSPVLFFVNGSQLVAFPTPHKAMAFLPVVSNVSFSKLPYRNAFNSCVIYPGERVTFEYEGVLALGQGKNFSLVITAPPNEVFSFRVLSMPPYFANYSFTTG